MRVVSSGSAAWAAGLGLALGQALCVDASHGDFVAPTEHAVRAAAALPFALSDMTATALEAHEAILLTGGCRTQEVDAEFGFPFCSDISDVALLYYPHEDRFEEIPARMPAPRYRQAAVLHAGQVFLMGGLSGDSPELRRLEIDVLDVETLTWSTLAAPARLSAGVSDASGFVLGGALHLVGGWIDGYAEHGEGVVLTANAASGAFDSAPVALANPAGLRGDAAGVVIGDRAFLIGGFTNAANAHTASIEVFDGVSGEWTEHPASLRLARGDAAVAALGEKVYVISGEVADGTDPSIEIYLAAEEKWVHGGELGEGRFRSAAAGMDGAVYVFGGQQHLDDGSNTTVVIDSTVAIEETSGVYSMPTLTLHGSGTTNPSNFFWHSMDALQASVRVPTKMSYRAVGSGTGQKEFVGDEASGFLPYTQFGSGDIPLTQALYEQVTKHGHQVAQFPLGFGAIALYANVPEQRAVEGRRLVVGPCELAKIYKGDITQWSELADAFEGNEWLQDVDQPISAVHRVLGSSSTSGVTAYLNAGCPAEWGPELVSSKLDPWPCGDDCAGALGSGRVQAFIVDTPYSIGYLSVGHGYPAELREVALVNDAGEAVQSSSEGIQAAAAGFSAWPASAFGDFSGVSLINAPRAASWPIVLVSYLYVRKDLTTLGSSAALLKAFVADVLDVDAGQKRMQDYNFVPLTADVLQRNLEGLAELELASGVTEFTTETSTAPRTGAGAFVQSAFRENFAQQSREDASKAIEALELRTVAVEEMASRLGNNDNNDDDDDDDLEDDVETAHGIAVAALIFAIIDFIILLGVLYFVSGIRTAVKAAKAQQQINDTRRPQRSESDMSQDSEKNSASAAVRIV